MCSLCSTLKHLSYAVLSLTVFVVSIAGVTFADDSVKTPPVTAKNETDAAQPKQLIRFPIVDSEEAWKLIPAPIEACDKPLPLWARCLAKSLPETTAVMLEQDYAYRTSEAFDPKLRTKMRWTAARANRCDYSQAYAEADLRRLGASESEIQELKNRTAAIEPKEQAALDFARKMTLAAYSVSDQEVEELIDYYGEKTLVGMVLQMAFANFQDRLLLALNVPVEPDGPLPPIEVRFAFKKADDIKAAPRPDRDESQPTTNHETGLTPDRFPKTLLRGSSGTIQEDVATDVAATVQDLDWKLQTFEDLQSQLEKQRERQPRVRVPESDEVKALLPPGFASPDQPIRIKWNLAVMGNQPDLGVQWVKGLRTFAREAKQDRVFEETIFWVITRSLQCFY
jgi:alkylhydroperoxidase family enzyme